MRRFGFFSAILGSVLLAGCGQPTTNRDDAGTPRTVNKPVTDEPAGTLRDTDTSPTTTPTPAGSPTASPGPSPAPQP